ncbi:MAG TPA: TonB-dependent receptor [Puia sp.]|nr:TonB-dependent receptor [Puia sp.]
MKLRFARKKLAPKKSLLLFFFSVGLLLAQAQQTISQTILVSGTIKNEKGEPVEAASVRIRNTTKGTFTDKDGVFSLNVAPGDLLIISYVGYDTLQVKATPQMQLALHPSTGSLNDVVIIGYGSQRKKDLTGAISVVGQKDFQQGAITTPEQLIAGKVAGVSVTSNGGAPGSGSIIRIRGVASLNASNDPLIVIDGLPFSGNSIAGASNPLSLVNPNDIESFTILKDAASTAIYGSRASNGVILITTKKGARGRPVVSFSTQVSTAKLIKEADVLSASKFRSYVDSLGTGSWDNGVHTFKDLLGTANTDWQKEIYQTAVSTDNNLNITGSLGNNIPYRVSVGYLNQDGIVKTDNLQRYTAGIALTPHLLHDKLKLEFNLKGALNKTRFANAGSAISSAMYFDPTQPVHAKSDYGNYFEWTSTDAGGTVTLQKLAPRNPVALLDLYHNLSTVQRSFGNFRADYELPFLSGLHANVNLGYDIAKGDGTVNVPAYAAQNFLDGGQRNKYKSTQGNTVGEFYLNYLKDVPSFKSNFNVLAGYGYYDNLTTNYNYPSLRANGDTIPNSTSAYAYDKPRTTLLSYYGRLIYTFNTKYILEASIRSDGSSRFSPQTRWGTFPSAAFTWRINQENFLKTSNTLSGLNLRLSYGVTGNQDGIYAYPYLPVYSHSDSTSLVQFGNRYYTMATPAAYDANIKWEQTSSYNGGIDYGFFSNRIQGSIDIYYKKTKNLLNQITVPAGTNFSSTLLTNVGNMENKGIEFTIAATPVKTKDWSWDLNFNIAYNSNKITNLTATKDSSFAGNLKGDNNIQINSVGYNANAFYVYHQEYDKSGKPIEGVYADVNGDGIINDKDLYHYKSPFPKYILGFSTSVTYHRWTASTVLRANIGNYMYNEISSNAIRANVFNPLGYLANTFSELETTHFYYSQPHSDYYIQNASFLKMDNLGLSFNAGGIFHDGAHLRINANCQNVFTITKYKGQDPELYGGIDNTFYPRPRTYVLGVNLQF